jgi:RNA polymerase sigma-70 factor (ECF subfamily)
MISDRAKRAAREGNLARDKDGTDSRAPQPQQADLEQSERGAVLFRLVDELAEDQRRVLLMRFAEERSIREIANALGRSEGAVKQLQFRALENVRKRIHHRDTEDHRGHTDA